MSNWVRQTPAEAPRMGQNEAQSMEKVEEPDIASKGFTSLRLPSGGLDEWPLLCSNLPAPSSSIHSAGLHGLALQPQKLGSSYRQDLPRCKFHQSVASCHFKKLRTARCPGQHTFANKMQPFKPSMQHLVAVTTSAVSWARARQQVETCWAASWRKREASRLNATVSRPADVCNVWVSQPRLFALASLLRKQPVPHRDILEMRLRVCPGTASALLFRSSFSCGEG